MNVASLELCEQLYELSDWVDTSYIWHVPKWRDGNKIHEDHNAAYIVFAGPDGHDDGRKPAYDLSYLLRELPPHIDMSGVRCALVLQACIKPVNVGKWSCGYEMSGIGNIADTPEDAAAKLAIALFEQGVLHKGGEKS